MNKMLKKAPFRFVTDLAASTSSTVFPTLATQGKSLADVSSPQPPAWHSAGDTIAVMVDATFSAAPVSLDVHVYGWADDIGLWSYLTSLNAGSSITASPKWNVTATRVRLAETVSVGPKSYDRYMTRCVNSGTAITASTWIGFPVGE